MPIVQVLFFKCCRGICRYKFFIRKSIYSLCFTLINFQSYFWPQLLLWRILYSPMIVVSSIQRSSPWFNIYIVSIVRTNCKSWQNYPNKNVFVMRFYSESLIKEMKTIQIHIRSNFNMIGSYIGFFSCFLPVLLFFSEIFIGIVWRYQRGNQNSYIEEEKTIQCQKEKHKATSNDLQSIHIQLKIEQHKPH